MNRGHVEAARTARRLLTLVFIGVDAMNRRWFLQATAAMGTGCVTAGIQTGPLQAAGHGQIGTTPQEGPSTPHGAARFFQDADFNFVFLRMLGGAYHHVADVGACLAIAAQIQDGDAASAFQALTAAGDRLSASADAAAAAGRQVSARQAYLQAANYTFAATHFIDRMGAPDRFAPTWLRHQALWEQGAA